MLVGDDSTARSDVGGHHLRGVVRRPFEGSQCRIRTIPRISQAVVVGRLAAAESALNLSVSCGLEEARALPYLAEIAYAQRQFPLVRDYLGLIPSPQVTPVMSPVVRFWNPDRAAADMRLAA